MKTHVLHYEGFSISVADAWSDITDTLEDANAPLTFADPTSGVGALQFSPAIYKSGPLPRITSQTLSELLDEFALRRALREPFDRSTYPGTVGIEGGSFRMAGGQFMRAWYISDGKNVLLGTYVSRWKHRHKEASEREMSVRSIRFSA